MQINSTSAAAGFFASAASRGTQPPATSTGLQATDDWQGIYTTSKNLTQADRDTIWETTGVDFRANGEIWSQQGMTATDYTAALSSASKVAARRAGGDTTPIGSDQLSAVLRGLGFVGVLEDERAPGLHAGSYRFDARA